MTDAEPSAVQLFGETVTVSYVADPSLGHGQFRLENRRADSVTASVESGWLELGEEQRTLGDISVYDVDREQTLDPTNITLRGEETLTFLLGFPSIVYEPDYGEQSSVGIQVRVGDETLEARSPLEFVRRIPRGH